MDPELLRLIDLDTPKLNPQLANGLATTHMLETEKWIEDVFRTVAKEFPEGLVYEGGQRCSYTEEYRQVTKTRNQHRGLKKQTKRYFDTARSDIYMVKYHFRYKGVALEPVYIYLPFVGAGGSIVLSGSRFNISPVLSDRVISVPSKSSVFVRLIRDKFTFQRLPYSYQISDTRRETVQVIHSQIYHISGNASAKDMKPAMPAKTTAAHYLFTKFGVLSAFKQFAGFTPIIVDKYNPDEWDEDDWVICRSMRVRPDVIKQNMPYNPTKLVMIVPRQFYTPMTKAMVAGFFYVVDHLPDVFTHLLDERYTNSPEPWVHAMGRMLFPPSVASGGTLRDDVASHIESMDEYIDRIMKMKLGEIDVHVEDMYGFLAYLIENFNKWLRTYDERINSMYDKELNILYYVLFDITSAIFKTHFKLKAAAKKDSLPDEKAVSKIINMHLKTRLIFNIIKNSGVVASNTYPGDCKPLKITANVVAQSNSSSKGKNKNGDRAAMQDPSRKMHVSIAVHGAYSGMPKNEPTGRTRLNMHSQMDEKGTLLKPEHLAEMLDQTQKKISHGS